MHHDATRLEWYNCRGCGKEYTWFRVEVMAGVELWGWLHRIDEGCERDMGMGMTDHRPGINQDLG